MTTVLPIEPLKPRVLTSLQHGPVVVSAPTGSGKSTRIPVWLAESGPVLVVQPRRVAARSLAQRIAQTTNQQLGAAVGYIVRDERKAGPDTRICFVTTGIALQMAASQELARFHTIVLDEFHERTLDLDLLLALCLSKQHRLLIMSATLQADRIATHLGGVHLQGQGRQFPVDIRYQDDSRLPPSSDRLPARLKRVLDDLPQAGDVLVFLPGKSEINACMAALRDRPERVLPLHGQLTLAEQAQVFNSSPQRTIVLSTNVAESAVTIPGIRVVIDSGLERRTRYNRGRSTLAISAIALDSADQRAGRAGRTAPGITMRLWGQHATLQAHTTPEIQCESLVPLVLASLTLAGPEHLPWLDSPASWAWETAEQELIALGALSEGRLTERGRSLFKLPVDPALGRLILEAQDTDGLADVLDLVAVLSVSRPLFSRTRPEDESDDLRAVGCDGVARLTALRRGDPSQHHLNREPLHSARRLANRLRAAWGLPSVDGAPINRQKLVSTVLAAWPDCAWVKRARKRRVSWSNGGTEHTLGRDSAVDVDKTQAIIVLETHSVGTGTDQTLWITAAMPVRYDELLAAGRGRESVGHTTLVHGKPEAEITTTYAGKVIGTRTEAPRGAAARDSISVLIARGSVFSISQLQEAFRLGVLHAALTDQVLPYDSWEDWVRHQVEALGVEGADDLELLSAEDFEHPGPSPLERERLERDFPATLKIGQARFRVDVDATRRWVHLINLGPRLKQIPDRRWFPGFRGFRIDIEDRGRTTRIR